MDGNVIIAQCVNLVLQFLINKRYAYNYFSQKMQMDILSVYMVYKDDVEFFTS